MFIQGEQNKQKSNPIPEFILSSRLILISKGNLVFPLADSAADLKCGPAHLHRGGRGQRASPRDDVTALLFLIPHGSFPCPLSLAGSGELGPDWPWATPLGPDWPRATPLGADWLLL